MDDDCTFVGTSIERWVFSSLSGVQNWTKGHSNRFIVVWLGFVTHTSVFPVGMPLFFLFVCLFSFPNLNISPVNK